MERIRINKWQLRVEGDTVVFMYIHNNDTPTFVARYDIETILEHGGRELKVDAGIPEWTVRDYEMVAIVGWLKSITK